MRSRPGCRPSASCLRVSANRTMRLPMRFEKGVLLFNVESEEELVNIGAVASRMGKRAQVAIRVNPDVDPQTHPYIATGLKKSKFGIDINRAREQYQTASKLEGIEPSGVHCHIGSQITSSTPFADAVGIVVRLVGELRGDGHAIRYLNLGGGLGITYHDEAPPLPKDYAAAILPKLKDFGMHVDFRAWPRHHGQRGVFSSRACCMRRKIPTSVL